jgi:hypothetical protein
MFRFRLTRSQSIASDHAAASTTVDMPTIKMALRIDRVIVIAMLSR